MLTSERIAVRLVREILTAATIWRIPPAQKRATSNHQRAMKNAEAGAGTGEFCVVRFSLFVVRFFRCGVLGEKIRKMPPWLHQPENRAARFLFSAFFSLDAPTSTSR
jgi:hypothetical protein